MGDTGSPFTKFSWTHPNIAGNASIVLIGARGTGKSSLATIAQRTFCRKMIDVDDRSLQKTGIVRWENGAQQCAQHGLMGLKTVLEDHDRGHVIVWRPECIDEAGLRLRKKYSQTHPVIHVTRFAAAVQAYLRISDPSKFNRALDLWNRIYRGCSNFEYHNLDEALLPESSTSVLDATTESVPHARGHTPRTLRLKRVEQSFVRFVRNILHPPTPVRQSGGPDPIQPSLCGGQFPLPPSRSSYSYLLPIPLRQIISPDFDPEWLDCGADACQLEIDTLTRADKHSLASTMDEISRAFALLSRFFDGPILYHVPQQYAKVSGAAQYLDLLRQGFRLGADYVTIGLDTTIEKLVHVRTHKGPTRILGTFHDADPGHDGWSKKDRWRMYDKASELGLDGLRLTQMATNIEDNIAVSNFIVEAARRKGRQPFLIAYNTGPLGRPSRCTNLNLTPVTTAELSYNARELSAEDSELTIRSAQNALYGIFMYDPMQYYIIGFDVSYSLSPPIHSAAYRYFGMPHSFEIRSMSSLEGVKELLRNKHVGGISIAQGFKMSVLPFVSAMSTHADSIGAINTLIPIRHSTFRSGDLPPADFWMNRNRGGPVLGLYGENTDWSGITICVSRNLSPANIITSDTSALVIGAGGMARAALYALLQMGVRHVVLHNRTLERAKSLADHFKSPQPQAHGEGARQQTVDGSNNGVTSKPRVQVVESLEEAWPDELAQPTIIISCIPASSVIDRPGANFTLPLQWMKSPTGGVVLDLTYEPLVTPLLRQASQQADRGWIAVDGLEYLAAQALTQFELFTGRKVPQKLMRMEAFKGYLAKHENDLEGREVIRGKLMQ